MFIWYVKTFLIYFGISFDFEMKRKKNFITSRSKKKGEKSSISVHQESNPGQLIQSPTC